MTQHALFHIEPAGDALILVVQGNVSSLADDALIEQVQESLTDCGARTIIVDFAQVEYFGSVMLEALRALWTHVSANHGTMLLCNVSPISREILHVSRFDTLWPIYASRAEALQAAGQ